MRGFFIFEGTPSFLKKYQKGTPNLLIAVPQPQVILERQKNQKKRLCKIADRKVILHSRFNYEINSS